MVEGARAFKCVKVLNESFLVSMEPFRRIPQKSTSFIAQLFFAEKIIHDSLRGRLDCHVTTYRSMYYIRKAVAWSLQLISRFQQGLEWNGDYLQRFISQVFKLFMRLFSVSFVNISFQSFFFRLLFIR